MSTGTNRRASSDFFLKIEGIKGETQADGLDDYMEIVSFKWGGNHDGSFHRDEGSPTGRFTGTDFEFVMKTNTASPELMQACASGKTYTKATLVCRKSSGKPIDYLKVTLTPVMVSTFVTGFDPNNTFGDPVVVDQITLNFGKIVVEYKPVKDDGSAGPAREGGYNLQKRTAGK
jgi:type VI secretion system secreted protein Hcp